MSEERREFYFSYKSGGARQISKEEWEREWLEWWRKTQREAEKLGGKSST